MGSVALALAASVIVFLVRRHRAKTPRRSVPAAVRASILLDSAGASHIASRFGLCQGFGFLQHRVLGSAMKLRTISVRGTVRLPGALDIDIADDDWPVVAPAAEAFLRDVELVLRSEAAERGWEIEGELDLRYATLGEATTGRPVVAVARQRHIGSAATNPLVRTSGATQRVEELPPTCRTLDPEGLPPTVDLTDLPPTVHVPTFVMRPRDGSGPSLHLGVDDSDLIVGRCGDVDLVVPHPTVSARHCRLVRGTTGTWEIADLQSRNGTRVNSSWAHGSVPLALGDVIVLGAVHYEVAGL